MKLSVKLALLSASASLLMTSAFAATTLVNSTSTNSVYVSGDAGYGVLSTPDKNIQNPDGFIITGASHSNDGFAGGANVGFNHALNNFLVGAEFGSDYNGQAKYTETYGGNLGTQTVKISSWNLHLLATGAYVFNNGLNVFAKAGAARVEQKASFSGSIWDSVNSNSETEYQPMVAAGVGYRIKMVNIYAQYAHTFGKDASNFQDLGNSDGSMNVVSVDTIKLGVAYNFAI